MSLVKHWAWLGPGILWLGLLTACTIPPASKVSTVPAQQVVAIPELDNTAAIPLKVAVYIAPRVLGRSAILDLRQSGSATKNVINNGPTGAATIAAVTHYFPGVFDEVYLLAQFPDARLVKRKIDLVIVIQDTATRHQIINSQPPTEIWDSQIKLGLYRPDGTKLTQYSVVASLQAAAAPKPADADGMIRWIYHTSQESIQPAMRLALQRFPKAEVLNALRNPPVKTAHAKPKHDWQKTSKEFTQDIDKEKINAPLPDMTLEQYLNRPSQSAAANMTIANALAQLNSKIIAQYYARNPTVINQYLLNLGAEQKAINQVYIQQLHGFAAGQDPNKQPLTVQFIGGLNKKVQLASHAKNQPPHQQATLEQNNSNAAPASPSNANPQIRKSLTLLDGLNQIGKSASGGSSATNVEVNCLDELRRVKQLLLDHAKDSGAGFQLLRSAGSGAKVYSNKLCSTPVPQNINQEQSLNEAQRIALCGVQTVTCSMAKIYSGMECQLAVNRCRQESPLPK